MSGYVSWIVRLYAGLLRLYPDEFRAEFEEEMLTVFGDAVRDAAACSGQSLVGFCLRELSEWPGSVLTEHWFNALCRDKETTMRKACQGVYDTPGLVPMGGEWGRFLTRNALLRRGLDVSCSLTGLAVAAPLLLATAILVKLDSSGPVLFRQRRLGRGGRPFTMLKFRSMYCAAPGVWSSARASGRDPRVTRVGHVIRSLRLDELPQLVNVLKGEMSILGPRPELPQ